MPFRLKRYALETRSRPIRSAITRTGPETSGWLLMPYVSRSGVLIEMSPELELANVLTIQPAVREGWDRQNGDVSPRPVDFESRPPDEELSCRFLSEMQD